MNVWVLILDLRDALDTDDSERGATALDELISRAERRRPNRGRSRVRPGAPLPAHPTDGLAADPDLERPGQPSRPFDQDEAA